MMTPNYLIHYYKKREFLFKTITELSEAELSSTLNSLSDNNTWYGSRFSEKNRISYMHFRSYVEKFMYNELEERYSQPPSKHPVYMYLSTKTAEERILGLKDTPYADSKYISIKLSDIQDKANISFTVDDSMWSFGFDLFRKGIIDWNPALEMEEKEFHGKLYHINELQEVIKQYNLDEKQTYEVHFWDKKMLSKFG